MDSSAIELVSKLADSAEKIGFQFARIWPQMVAITFIQSLFWLILNPIMTAGFIYLGLNRINPYLKLRLEKAAQEKMYEQEQLWIGARAVYWAIAAVVLIGTILAFPDNLTGTLYPEATTALKLFGKS